ncbi:hypothetical protein ACHAWF_016427, partial [Thalassiosira exigua]
GATKATTRRRTATPTNGDAGAEDEGGGVKSTMAATAASRLLAGLPRHVRRASHLSVRSPRVGPGASTAPAASPWRQPQPQPGQRRHRSDDVDRLSRRAINALKTRNDIAASASAVAPPDGEPPGSDDERVSKFGANDEAASGTAGDVASAEAVASTPASPPAPVESASAPGPTIVASEEAEAPDARPSAAAGDAAASGGSEPAHAAASDGSGAGDSNPWAHVHLHEFAPKIVVVGVGGAGTNAVNNMVASGLAGVEFLALNTDAQHLSTSLAPTRLQIGTHLT